MAKISKKRKEADGKVDVRIFYPVLEVVTLVKEVNTAKFNASVDLHVRLGVDPRKADQAIRGTVTLPNGTGKVKTVLVLCNPDKVAEAKEAGADHVGLDDYITQIKNGWTDVDVIIATPDVMAKIGQIGRILGPRNLMPNPKTGTVTTDVAGAVNDVKKGKISFRVDKFGIIHTTVGRVSFTPEQLAQNVREMLTTLERMKPSTAKGIYMRSIALASTMSPGIKIDPKSI